MPVGVPAPFLAVEPIPALVELGLQDRLHAGGMCRAAQGSSGICGTQSVPAGEDAVGRKRSRFRDPGVAACGETQEEQPRLGGRDWGYRTVRQSPEELHLCFDAVVPSGRVQGGQRPRRDEGLGEWGHGGVWTETSTRCPQIPEHWSVAEKGPGAEHLPGSGHPAQACPVLLAPPPQGSPYPRA